MNYKPARYDLTIYQGASFDHTIVYKLNGVAQDLSDLDAGRLVAKDAAGNTVVTIDDSGAPTVGEFTVTDAAAGEFNLYMKASLTEALDFDTANYILELEFTPNPGHTENEVFRVMEGCLRLDKEFE